MIEVRELQDMQLVKDTITNEAIYPHVTDDFSPEASAYVPAGEPMKYAGVYVEGQYFGLFAVHPHSVVLWEVHTCLLPKAWGACAIDCAKALIDWVFSHTTCERLITSVPSTNRLALRLARKAGMVEWGTNPASFRKGGKLVDLVMLGIGKGAICQ